MNRKILKHFSEVGEGLSFLDPSEIQRAVDILKLVRDNLRGTVYLFGNGGSHATASHFANDLTKMCRLRAVCIGDMAPSMLAYGNDSGWGSMFAGPLARFVNPAVDVVIGLSCSGNSENVINALIYARSREILTIGMTGGGSGEIAGLKLDALIRTPGTHDIRTQEDLHSIVCHAIARALQESE